MADIQMTPGNRNPGRYKKTTLSIALTALIASGASAPAIYSHFLDEKEGNRLTAYQDGERIWTICRGLTRIDGQAVRAGMTLTKEQCDFYNAEHIDVAMAQMQRLVAPDVWASLSEPAKAGISSFCVTNIGPEKCKASTFLRLLNSGARRNDYCAQITYWIRDSGRDCRRAGSNCQGQPIRRMQEDEMCLIPAPHVAELERLIGEHAASLIRPLDLSPARAAYIVHTIKGPLT